MSIAFYNAIMREKELDLYKEFGVGKVIEIKSSKLRNTSTDRSIWYQYHVGDSIYKSVSRTSNEDIKVGDCYKIKYSSKSPEIVDIFLDENIECTD